MDDRLIFALRAMAWERAKGELQGYLHTFWPSYGPNGNKIENGFEEANSRIEKFIKDFGDNCQ